MIAFEQGTLYAVLTASGEGLLLVSDGLVIASAPALAWTRGRPWEEIERRLLLVGCQVRRLVGEDGEGAPAAMSVPG